MSLDSFVCNICFLALDKVRFKCTSCIDYDVCKECLQKEDCAQTHRDHIFLKVLIGADERDQGGNISDETVRTVEVTIADRLAVLDGLHLFKLDADTIAQQLRMAVAKVRLIINEMLEDEVSSRTIYFAEQCPMLEELDCTCTTLTAPPSRGDSTITRGPEMFTLWECLQAVGNEDDVSAVAEMNFLEDWVSWRDAAKEYNMSSLLRNNSIAAKLTREPAIQKKILNCSYAVVPGSTRILWNKRKALAEALKKQSRSRTKAAVEEIAAYALETHFTPDAVAAQRAANKQKSASRHRKSSEKHHSSKSKSKGQTNTKKGTPGKHKNRSKSDDRTAATSSRTATNHVEPLAPSGHAGTPSPIVPPTISSGASEPVVEALEEAARVANAEDDAAVATESDSSTDTSDSDDSDDSEDSVDAEELFERILQAQCEALLPSNMRSTRTMRKEAIKVVAGTDPKEASLPSHTEKRRRKRAPTGRPRGRPRKARPEQPTAASAQASPASGYLSEDLAPAGGSCPRSSCPRALLLSPHEEGLVQQRWAQEWRECCDSSSPSCSNCSSSDDDGEEGVPNALLSCALLTMRLCAPCAPVTKWAPDTTNQDRQKEHAVLLPASPEKQAPRQYEELLTSDRVQEVVTEKCGEPLLARAPVVLLQEECAALPLILVRTSYPPADMAAVLTAHFLTALRSWITLKLKGSVPRQLSVPLPRSLTVESCVLKLPAAASSTSATTRSILKKRSIWESVSDRAVSSAGQVGGASKKSVHFDITASMQYKRWRVGKLENFSVQEALMETETIRAERSSAVPGLASTPHTSILKKRSISAVSPDEVAAAAGEPSATAPANGEHDSAHGKHNTKRVRFTEDVPEESKPRTGPYMGYKQRLAERLAALTAHLTTTPSTPTAVQGVPAPPAPPSESDQGNFSEELGRDIDSLGSFWSGYQSPKRARTDLFAPNTAGAVVVSPEPSAASSTSGPAVPVPSAPLWKPKLAQQPARGQQESDTESDSSSDDSSVELNIALPELYSDEATPAITSPPTDPTLPAAHAAAASPAGAIRAESVYSVCSIEGSTTTAASRLPVEPCALSSMYEEFDSSATAPSSMDKGATSVLEQCNNENADTSNACAAEDESSPFFDDEPGLVVAGRTYQHQHNADDLLWQKNWTM